MKLSENTLAVLHSFSNINSSIMIKKGNVIKTKPELADSPSVKAVIDEEFPVDFAIYEFKKLLQIISLFNNPEFEFNKDHMIITGSSNQTSKIYYDDPNHVTDPNYERNFKLPNVDVSFDIEYETIQTVIKSAKTLGHSEICFKGENGKLYIASYRKRQKDNFSIELGNCSNDFQMIFSISDFNMIKTKYNVELCFQGIAKFESTNLTYWIAPINDTRR